MTNLDPSTHHDIDIFIFSDSQAALRAIDSFTTNSKTISECRKPLNEVATHLVTQLPRLLPKLQTDRRRGEHRTSPMLLPSA